MECFDKLLPTMFHRNRLPDFVLPKNTSDVRHVPWQKPSDKETKMFKLTKRPSQTESLQMDPFRCTHEHDHIEALRFQPELHHVTA